MAANIHKRYLDIVSLLMKQHTTVKDSAPCPRPQPRKKKKEYYQVSVVLNTNSEEI